MGTKFVNNELPGWQEALAEQVKPESVDKGFWCVASNLRAGKDVEEFQHREHEGAFWQQDWAQDNGPKDETRQIRSATDQGVRHAVPVELRCPVQGKQRPTCVKNTYSVYATVMYLAGRLSEAPCKYTVAGR